MKKFILLCFMAISTLVSYSTEWEKKNFVDEFKRPTEEDYYTNKDLFEGLYENSVYKDLQLLVRIVIEKSDISFVLYEYGTIRVNGSTKEYDILYIGDDEIKKKAKGIFLDRLYVSDSDKEEFISTLESSKETIILIKGTGYERKSKYLFIVPKIPKL